MLSYCDILFCYLTIQLLAARVFNKPRSLLKIAVVNNPLSYMNMTLPVQGTPAKIRINIIMPETIESFDYILPLIIYGSIVIQIFVVGSERRIFCAIERPSDVVDFGTMQ